MKMFGFSFTIVAVAVVTVGVGLCSGQAPPVPCCAPEQFTVHYEQVATTQKGDLAMEITTETLDAAYDFTNAVVGMEVSAHPINGTETKLKLIQNFTSGFQWVIEGSQCTKQPLSSRITPDRCVPAGATFEGTFNVGLEKLKVHSWRIKADVPNEISGNQTYTVTDYMCTPFSSTFIGKLTSTQPPTLFVTSGNYLNFVDKITDPDKWFKLPPFCNNSSYMVDARKPLTKFPKSPSINFF